MQFWSLALQSPEHQYWPSKLSKPMLVKSSATASADFHRIYIFKEKSHGRNFNVIYSAIKLFWFANNFSFARADPLTHTSSLYRAGCGQPWLSLTWNQPVFSRARQARAEYSALDFLLALNMNFDTLLLSCIRSRVALARKLEFRPPDHLREPKLAQVRD